MLPSSGHRVLIHSHTVVPYYKSRIIPKAVLRIDVGGKLLTNQEIISYRQLHVLVETYVLNQVKEDTCCVSQDFFGDMEIARKRGQGNTLVQEYVLPDFSTRRRGMIREHLSKSSATSDEQSLRLANARFAVPEILFHPPDIGIEQMGIPEAIAHAISLTPREMHPHLYANIVLTGGNTVFSGFYERMGTEIRKLAPTE